MLSLSATLRLTLHQENGWKPELPRTTNGQGDRSPNRSVGGAGVEPTIHAGAEQSAPDVLPLRRPPRTEVDQEATGTTLPRRQPLEKSLIMFGRELSSPTQSSMPASDGSAILNPELVNAATISLAGMPIRSRYWTSA
jgi:hypothetical protein